VARTLAPEAVASALEGVPVGRGLRVDLDFVGRFVGRILWLGRR
jgi:hypothetical protein